MKLFRFFVYSELLHFWPNVKKEKKRKIEKNKSTVNSKYLEWEEGQTTASGLLFIVTLSNSSW